MFTAAAFTTAKLWNQLRCPLRDEWIKKMWYICKMEYYSAIKNEIVSFAGKWIGLKIIILRKRSQTQKDKHHVFHSYEESRLKIKYKKA
jgi:hypothetical protein